MKAIIFVVYILLFGFLMATNIFGQDSASTTAPVRAPSLLDAKDITFERLPFNKLARGATNTLFFWLEVPAGVHQTAKEENNEFIGFSLGLIKGVFTGFLRGVTGIFDLVTFIIPPYDRPLMEPEYVFSRFD